MATKKSASKKSASKKATKKVATKKTTARKTPAKKTTAKKSAKKAAGRKYGPSVGNDVEREMRAMKQGKLKSSSGQKVTSRKQAIAIALSEARGKGKKVPAKKK